MSNINDRGSNTMPENRVESAGRTDDNSGSPGQSDEHATVVVAPREQTDANGEDHQAQERRYWRGQSRLSLFSLMLAFIAAGGGITSAIIASRALEVSQRALIASQGAADEAHRQADQATAQTGIFQRQAELSVEANRLNADSGRAWIASMTAFLTKPPVAGDKFAGRLQMTNPGREPATVVSSSNNFGRYSVEELANGTLVREMDKARDACFATPAGRPEGIIFPTTNTSTYNMTLTEKTANINPITIDEDIVNGKAVMTLSGCYTYKSIGQLRHTSYCFIYDARKEMGLTLAFCPAGNEAD